LKVATGTLASARDTNAPGKREDGRPGYSSRYSSRTAPANRRRARWWARRRARSCEHARHRLLLPIRQRPGL